MISPADRFIRRLGAVPETTMRVALWRELFDQASPEALLDTVDRVIAGLVHRTPDHRLAYLSLLALLETLRGCDFEPRRGLYEAARFAENEPVMRLLLTAPAAREAAAGALRPPQFSDDRELTLGERRSLARTHDRELISRLLYDPDPGVIGNLLANPHLTESDVLRIASRRPTSGKSLTLVFHHPRWGRSPPIQRALVYNPYTPVDVAFGLVTILELAEIRQVAQDPGVPAVVRDRAQDVLKRREALSSAT